MTPVKRRPLTIGVPSDLTRLTRRITHRLTRGFAPALRRSSRPRGALAAPPGIEYHPANMCTSWRDTRWGG
ncbi:hypothetical protein GCM10010272_44730 [Streptomyces lateritius]|nr:hypothetical protein GCM10010272_44730 [Streptomyces lateritius]